MKDGAGNSACGVTEAARNVQRECCVSRGENTSFKPVTPELPQTCSYSQPTNTCRLHNCVCVPFRKAANAQRAVNGQRACGNHHVWVELEPALLAKLNHSPCTNSPRHTHDIKGWRTCIKLKRTPGRPGLQGQTQGKTESTTTPWEAEQTPRH